MKTGRVIASTYIPFSGRNEICSVQRAYVRYASVGIPILDVGLYTKARVHVKTTMRKLGFVL